MERPSSRSPKKGSLNITSKCSTAYKEDARTETFAKQSIAHETAQKMVAAAVAKATALGVPQVVAALDESRLLKAFCHMDGAAPVSIDVAQNKAYATLFDMPSRDFYNFIKDDPALRQK